MEQAYYNYLVNEIGLRPTNIELTTNDHQNIECVACGHTFNATPKSKVANFKKWKIKGCPKCTWNIRYAIINEANIKKLNEKFEILSDYGNDNYVELTVRNRECGHTFTSRKGNLLNRDVTCPVCNVDRKRAQLLANSEELQKNSLANKTGFAKYQQLVNHQTKLNYKKYKNIINPNDYPRVLAKHGNVGYHLDHIVSIYYCFHHDIPIEVCADYRNLRMIPWNENTKKNIKPTARFPEIFYPYVKSVLKIEEFILHIKNNVDIDFEVYKDFGHHTLSLYNDEFKFGILYITFNEYTEQVLGSSTHFTKMKKRFDDMGIRVLFIYEDEWKRNPGIIISKIRHIAKHGTGIKVYARKCIIKEINVEDKGKFLNAFHVQGACGSQINLGAYYKDELVAVMTFNTPRIAMNKNIIGQKDKWELSRFSTHSTYHIVGIASKLLSHFEKNYQWKEIYSFADRRWSEGNVYYQLGFTLDRINPGEYFYIIDGNRKHRYGFRKDALKERFVDQYDPNLTEYQNMRNFGYDRIWDCGTLKFIKHPHNI